jgi:hypothetical protein
MNERQGTSPYPAVVAIELIVTTAGVFPAVITKSRSCSDIMVAM